MSKSKIVEHGGVYIDMSHVQCFKLKNKTTLVVEHKTRIEYVYNPSSEQLEKEYINDGITEINFPDVETAEKLTADWISSWKHYVA